ncbi:MAG: sodium:solute symporter family protein [Desulfatiglans sp.]|jgi:SSS family solute:Na+ symporter|nr:sodium:solute symporter family protein [Thermodesulfobacteriota bacterium]MEE4353258.1 sodium:solute symporter family protein [Desulfatiglans sp.]
MTVKVSVLIGYFLVVLAIGFIARTRWKSSPATYFLADRKLGTWVLLGTMVATNFSAFTVFGTSGAGYRDGYAFFPIMGFGTGFMALTFWILGRKIWEIGKENEIVTPPELIDVLYKNRFLSCLFALVMIVFTVPYLALQPMAAGYALEELIGIPYFTGALLVTGVILLYTLRGGLRAVAWTDMFQGVLMALLLAVSLVLISKHHGGFAAANQKVMAMTPDLFSRPGGQGKYTVMIWFSYIMLWFFCDPMFPQLFQRFFSAQGKKTISKMMIFYPLVCTVVFLMPIAIGVLGHLSFPDLVGKQADRILPMVITLVSGDIMSALVIACGLAALMSTMDSQLLTLSSIFTRDILPLATGKQTRGNVSGKIFVIFLSILGLALAYRPPATILQIATQTFTGLAVLFPTVIFGLYLKRVRAVPAILSILAGEGMMVLYYFNLIPTGGFLPVVPVMVVAFSVYLIAYGVVMAQNGELSVRVPRWVRDPYFIAFLVVFLLSMDFWAWDRTHPQWAGIPLWMGYFVFLSGLQTLLMTWLFRRSKEQGI